MIKRLNSFQFYRSSVVSALLLGSLIIFGCSKNNNLNSSNNISNPQNNNLNSSNNNLNSSNNISTPKPDKAALEINRKSFSFSLPNGWTEKKDAPSYNAEALASFENQDNCLFMVIIGKKSAGASLDKLLMAQKTQFQKTIPDAKTTEFTKWGDYEDKGFEFEGTAEGIVKIRARLFGFENTENICVIVEYGTLDEWKKYAGDFEMIQNTFKLKSN